MENQLSLINQLENAALKLEQVRQQVKKHIVGQNQLLDFLLLSLLTNGHSLLIGVPGLAKTKSVQALAAALNLGFHRIQFTPDLLPSDITGSEILDQDAAGHRFFRFVEGPIFANLVLADEINRTPPRTQAALLEAMQEHAVTIGQKTYPLPKPFIVLATQNPIEQEGTFPLPEAQLDRFFSSITLTYPSAAEEEKIVAQTTGAQPEKIEASCHAEDLVAMQDLVMQIAADVQAVEFAVALVRATRPGPSASEFVQKYVAWGAGPRASQDLVLAAKAMALLKGRPVVALQDLHTLMPNIVGHRLVLNFAAQREGITVDDVFQAIRTDVTIRI